jgi:addiction module HigA family antidote
MTAELAPVTPGELLLEEFLDPMGISQYRLAKEIGVPAQRIGEIVHGKRSITADTDLRLCRFFGLSDGYWLRAQALHDTEVARRRLDSNSKGYDRGQGRPRKPARVAAEGPYPQNTRTVTEKVSARCRTKRCRRSSSSSVASSIGMSVTWATSSAPGTTDACPRC